jgi:phytoene synthase
MEAMDPAVQSAYEACRRLQRRHDPTYYWATRRLPAAVRPATHALYGYVRTADEIVDGPGRPPTPDARRAALDAWEAELRDGLRQGSSPHPVVGALVDAASRHELPLDELGPYMRSMRVDCGPVRIETWDELQTYMDGSAGGVGRIMAALLGVPERHRAGFGPLGQAFQLTNFVRDLGEDARLDRVYLPGAEPAALAAPRATPEVRAIVADHVARARALFAAAEPAVLAAPASVRSGIRLACAAYLRILDRAEAARYDVLARGVGLRPWHLPGVLRGAARR